MSRKDPIRVRNVMRDRYVVVEGLETVADALVKMKEARAGMAIVSKRHDDDEIGIVLLSDIARQVLAKDRSPARTNVYEIMAKPVISVPPDMDIRYCARLFNSFGLAIAPVIEKNQVIGVISYTEMVLDGLWPSVSD